MADTNNESGAGYAEAPPMQEQQEPPAGDDAEMLSTEGRHEYQRLCEHNDNNTTETDKMLTELEMRRAQAHDIINEAFDGAKRQIMHDSEMHVQLCQELANKIMVAEQAHNENHALIMKVQDLAANF